MPDPSDEKEICVAATDMDRVFISIGDTSKIMEREEAIHVYGLLNKAILDSGNSAARKQAEERGRSA